MIDRKDTRHHQTWMIISMLLAIVVNGGFFPLVNFNPANPVDLGITMRWIILTMTALYCMSIGTLEAILLPNWSAMQIAFLNIAMTACGLLGRYLLEFGEVSNTYNFTPLNVAFHVITVAALSTIMCVWKQRNSR